MLLCAAAAAGLAGRAAAATQAIDPAELYHEYCSVCHGDRGDGRSRAQQGLVPPPRDFTVPGAAQSLTRESMLVSVLEGRPGTAMAGWKTRLSREQAEAIVDYVRTSLMHAPAAATRPGYAKATPNSIQNARGEFARGRALFDANCAICHGADGDGKGPRAYFIFPKPRDFTSEAARLALSRTALLNAVRNGVQGREMPAWGKVLTEQQLADVSEYVYLAFVRPRGDRRATRQP